MAPEGSYLLSFRFREARRALIARRIEALCESYSETIDIVPESIARAHGLFSRRNGMHCLENQDEFVISDEPPELDNICA